MSIARWDPFRELEDMSERLNRAFGRSGLTRAELHSKDAMTVFDWSPTVDIVETPEEFQIKAELPEVKKEDVKVSVDAGILRIEGERKQEKEEKGKKYHRIERSYGSFLRTFTLPDNVDLEHIQSTLDNGVLKLHVPKKPGTQPRKIAIGAPKSKA